MEWHLTPVTWFRRLLGLDRPVPPKLHQLIQRLDELEERVDFQSAALKKLRGRVVGGTRGQPNEEEEEPPPDPLPLAPLLARRITRRGF